MFVSKLENFFRTECDRAPIFYFYRAYICEAAAFHRVLDTAYLVHIRSMFENSSTSNFNFLIDRYVENLKYYLFWKFEIDFMINQNRFWLLFSVYCGFYKPNKLSVLMSGLPVALFFFQFVDLSAMIWRKNKRLRNNYLLYYM